MLNRPTYFTEQVLIPVTVSTGNRITFPEQPNLEGVQVLGIEAFTAAQLAFDPQGRPVIAAGDASRVMLTFQERTTDKHKFIPYSALVAQLNAGAVAQFGNLQVNWPKSYATIPIALGTVPVVLVLNIHYLPTDAAKREGLE